MGRRQRIYNFTNYVSAVLMVLTLSWLTISAPFVYTVQLQQKAYAITDPTHHDLPDAEDSAAPFANTTEEKASTVSANSLSEEYLYHDEDLFRSAQLFLSHKRDHASSEYVAFHGETLCPPPNFTLL